MVRGQLHGMHSGGGSSFSKNSCVRQECPIRHLLKLIPAGAQMMSAWLVNDGWMGGWPLVRGGRLPGHVKAR